MQRPPTLLIVAMANSVHVHRWIEMIRGRGIRIFLLGTYEWPGLPPLAGVRQISSEEDARALAPDEIGVVEPDPDTVRRALAVDAEHGYVPWCPHWMPARVRSPGELAAALDMVRPDFVHSMEIQFAGYLCSETKRRAPEAFPPWLLGNWGSDIYLFRKLAAHRPRLERVARQIDYYLPECCRDTKLVEALGFSGTGFDPVPASGGIDLGRFAWRDEVPPPSRRKVILVKGYQTWAGRALTALAAVRLASDALDGYAVRVTLASREVQAAVQTLAAETGLDIRCEPYFDDHESALRHMASARMAIGIGISDGISTSMLEAMAFGTFPIQSHTSCLDEWTRDGATAYLVDPYDSAEIAERIRAAAGDDDLVDAAAEANRRTIAARWNAARNRDKVIGYYDSILRGASPPRGAVTLQ